MSPESTPHSTLAGLTRRELIDKRIGMEVANPDGYSWYSAYQLDVKWLVEQYEDVRDKWVTLDAEYDRLKEQLESFQELADDARAITQIGHGLELDVPTNIGSFKWVESAYHVLLTMASLASNPATKREDSNLAPPDDPSWKFYA